MLVIALNEIDYQFIQRFSFASKSPMENPQTQPISILQDIPPCLVHSVRTILQSRLGLPPELASIIISLASYYGRVTAHRRQKVEFRTGGYFDPDSAEPAIAGLYLISPSIPLPDEPAGEMFRIKSVTFKMRAADQGWVFFGGNGTYHNSHTWFEASILQPEDDRVSYLSEQIHYDEINLTFPKVINASKVLHNEGFRFRPTNDEKVSWKVHNNITARSEPRNYCVEWVAGKKLELKEEKEGMGIGMGDGEGFVETLRPGDSIALWARAEQYAWRHIVEEAAIMVEFEVE